MGTIRLSDGRARLRKADVEADLDLEAFLSQHGFNDPRALLGLVARPSSPHDQRFTHPFCSPLSRFPAQPPIDRRFDMTASKASANNNTSPFTTICRNDDTLRMLMPLSIVVKSTVPAIAPGTDPTPPLRDVPPITAPAMASSSRNRPELAVAAPRRAVIRTPATP